MTDPKPTYVACPGAGCHGLSYSVLYDHRTNVAHVICSGCNRELLAVTMTPPEERGVKVAPI